MKLGGESKFLIIITLLSLAIVGAGILIFTKPSTTPPTATTISKEDLIPATAATLGNREAAHHLVEFSDFQCPACKAYQPTINYLTSKYPNELLFAYRHFPLDQHPAGLPAAQAAQAALNQGKFFELAELLFTNQETLNDDSITNLAKSLDLDMTKYETDFAAARSLVLEDRAFGLSIGVNSTPTFFLDGIKLELSGPTDLQKQVEAVLQK